MSVATWKADGECSKKKAMLKLLVKRDENLALPDEGH